MYPIVGCSVVQVSWFGTYEISAANAKSSPIRPDDNPLLAMSRLVRNKEIPRSQRGLAIRAQRACYRLEIDTFQKLADFDCSKFVYARNFGKKSYVWLKKWAATYGVYLRHEDDVFVKKTGLT